MMGTNNFLQIFQTVLLLLLLPLSEADLRGGSSTRAGRDRTTLVGDRGSTEESLSLNSQQQEVVKVPPFYDTQQQQQQPSPKLDLTHFDAKFFRQPTRRRRQRRRSLATGGGEKGISTVDAANYGGKGARKKPSTSSDSWDDVSSTTTSAKKGKGKGKGGSKGKLSNGGGSSSISSSPVRTGVFEFVMIRDEFGTMDTRASFGLSSSMALKGYITELVHNSEDGSVTHGGSPVGTFSGSCSVVSMIKGERLCTYEIVIASAYLYPNEEMEEEATTTHNIGAIIAMGTVQDEGDNMLIVTSAEYEFEEFNGGILQTTADSSLPMIYATLTMSGYY